MSLAERPRVWAAILLCALFAAAWWLLDRRARTDDDSPFFAAEAPAEWILYPRSPSTLTRSAVELETSFHRRFTLSAAPTRARLRVRMHRAGTVQINGTSVPFASTQGERWKEAREGDVALLLQAGENRIEARARSIFGPAAIWLVLEAGEVTLASDASWTSSAMGAEEAPARLARVPMAEWSRAAVDLQAQDELNPRPIDALSARAPTIALAFAVGAGLSLGVAWLLRRKRIERLTPRWTLCAWMAVALVWVALFAHNGSLDRGWGFDVSSHYDYVGVVLQQGRLPLADEGWQMYQPPLYYLLAAGLLKLAGHVAVDQSAVELLRWLGCTAGVLQALFLLLALREVWPARPGLVLCAFLFGACLPIQLYMFQFVTNETWVAMLASSALWWTLRMLRRRTWSAGEHAILGMFLGLAMLAKFSALIPLALCIGVVTVQRWRAGARGLGEHAKLLGLTFAVILALCGWHYVRVALHFGGNPFVGNWDAASGNAWWQDPGYHVLVDYLRFGTAFERPQFSAMASFPDALYSTLWGDGMLAGSGFAHLRPPWDFELMAAGYLVALLPCLALLLGAVLLCADFLRTPRASSFLSIAVLGATLFALVSMTLRLPFYAQAKAFYGSSALVPLAIAFALGFDALALRVRWLAPIGIAWLAGWAVIGLATFCADAERLGEDPSKANLLVDRVGWLAKAGAALEDGREGEAIACLQGALRADPDQVPTGGTLTQLLYQAGRFDEALTAARAALRSEPDSAALHVLAGELWRRRGDLERALFHFDFALRWLPGDAVAELDLARTGKARALAADSRWSEALALLQGALAQGQLTAESARILVELLLDAPPPHHYPARALELATSVEQSTGGGDPAILETLARAQAANAQAAAALRTQERAVQLWRERNDRDATFAAEERLVRYQAAIGG